MGLADVCERDGLSVGIVWPRDGRMDVDTSIILAVELNLVLFINFDCGN